MSKMRLAAVFAILAASLSPGARADWPMSRHDVRRTALADGVSDIVKPAEYWRGYLGRVVTGAELMPHDIDGDGTIEVVYTSGGRLAAAGLDGSEKWQSGLIGISTLVGAADFDGDGVAELIAHSRDRVFLLAAKTGKLLWSEPLGEMGTIGAVRASDLDGDGKTDLLIQECGCCAANSGKAGFVYSFAGGFTAPKLLWTLPAAACAGSLAAAIGDFDGDGKTDVINGDSRKLRALHGAAGDIYASSDDLGKYGDGSRCVATQVDGDKAQELFCVQALVGATPSAHRAFVLKYVGSPTPAFKTLWDHDIGALDGSVDAPTPPLDLDGDGKIEVVVTARESDSSLKTYVLDAGSGVELATFAGKHVATSGTTLLIQVGTDLIGATFTRAPAAKVTENWKVTDAQAALHPDRGAILLSAFSGRLATLPLTSSTRAYAVRGRPATRVTALDLLGDKMTIGATLDLPKGVTATATWTVPLTKTVLVGRDDGRLGVFDSALSPTPQDGQLRFGGYVASSAWRELGYTPVVASLDGGTTQSVLVVDSRGSLLRWNAKDATNIVGPTTVWTVPYAYAPAVVSGSTPTVACLQRVQPLTEPPDYQVVALKAADGTPAFQTKLDGYPLSDVIPGDLDADGTADLVVQWGKSSDQTIRTWGFSGKGAGAVWKAPDAAPRFGSNTSGHTLFDWDGDGVLDVLYQADLSRVISGKTGKELTAGGGDQSYAMLSVFDVDKDGVPEIVLHSTHANTSAYHKGLTPTDRIWRSSEDDLPFPYGAMVNCSTGGVFVGSSLSFPGRLKVVALNGPATGTENVAFLAGGKLYPSAAAADADGAKRGVLSAVTAHRNLIGTSQPLVMVGSSDGWLYAIEACTRTLAFSYDFGSPVGEPVYGDSDGDGKDEIIVSVGDGYVHALRNEGVPSPAQVLDLDPNTVSIAAVSTIRNSGRLRASWTTVFGATSYEVAAAQVGGTYVTTPAWKDVGATTTVTLTGLALKDNERYVVSVRAKKGTDVGSDRVSAGVLVTSDPAADAGADAGADSGPETNDVGPVDSGVVGDATTDAGFEATPEVGGGGCGCRTSRGSGEAGLVALVAGLALWCRRKRP